MYLAVVLVLQVGFLENCVPGDTSQLASFQTEANLTPTMVEAEFDEIAERTRSRNLVNDQFVNLGTQVIPPNDTMAINFYPLLLKWVALS